jgi:hypothetical protein
MAYTRTRATYGPRGYQMANVFTPAGGLTDRPWILFIPGGGWGYRSSISFEDPESMASPAWWGGSLANPLSTFADKYVVFVAQVASNSHNGILPTAFSAVTIDPWADTDTIAFGDKREYGARTFIAKQAHTAAAGVNEPAGGTTANDFWDSVVPEDANQPLIANRGEQQNAYGAQAVADIRQCMAYIKQNAAKYGISQDNGAIAGESAGGFDAFRFMTMGSGPFARGEHPSSTHPFKAHTSTMPKAAIIGITPTHIDQYVRTTPGVDQAFMRSLMPSLYGRPEINGVTEWDELPSHVRQGIDPLHNMARTGVSCPTYIDHGFDSNFGDLTNQENSTDPITDTDVFEGYVLRREDANTPGTFINVNVGPGVHHARNGWRAFKELTGPRNQNFQARADCVFAQKSLTANMLETYTIHGDYPGGTPTSTSIPAEIEPIISAGVVTNQAAVTARKIERRRVLGDMQITWLDQRLAGA